MNIVTKQVVRVSKVLAGIPDITHQNNFLSGVLLGLEIAKEVESDLRKEVKEQLTYKDPHA